MLEIPSFLYTIAELAQQNSQEVYLVGGAVRDLLMKTQLADLDLLCSKDAIGLAKFLEVNQYAEVKSIHERFGTAKIILSDGKLLDLATARTESYEFPGALPQVICPADVNIDLKRRDFTINAIALRIFPDKSVEYVDPFDGREDLQNKTIKVLHEKSYWEDPTRIIRAARFATRFGFEITESDKQQIFEALKDTQLQGMIKRIRAARVRTELQRLLELPNWIQGAKLLQEINGWALCEQELSINFSEPPVEFLRWEERLVWLLKDNVDYKNIFKDLGIKVVKLKV
jgi:tRNA nucleotidyltransferase (CCA-adding enzyme)